MKEAGIGSGSGTPDPNDPNDPNNGGSGDANEQQLTEAQIAGEEGFRGDAYKDSVGKWTIGYGQTTMDGRAVKQGDKMSKEQAVAGLRTNIKSHRDVAISQVGQEKWDKLDPKVRASLTSVAYNYGSLPDRIMPAVKTGDSKKISDSLSLLHGDNGGDLKGRRQRESSVINTGTSDKLDKDFMSGGKYAVADGGGSITGAGGNTATGSNATFGETGNVSNAANWVHGHFQSSGTKENLINDTAPMVMGLLQNGVKTELADGTKFTSGMSLSNIKDLIKRGMSLHKHSGDGRSIDIFVPKGTKVPFPLSDVKNGGAEGRNGLLAGSGTTFVGHLTPKSKSGGGTHKPTGEGNMAKANNVPVSAPASQASAANSYPRISAAPGSPPPGPALSAASNTVALSSSAGGTGSTTNNYFATNGSKTQGNTNQANALPIGPSSSQISPGWPHEILAARLG
jgi:GH24 family phage-related lysozyme (muramidase)